MTQNIRASYVDRELEYIHRGDWYDKESGHSIVVTWWGFVHVQLTVGATIAHFIWQERLYQRTYHHAYNHKWHGRIAWDFARDVTQGEREDSE